jgi:hypothetical protein
MVVSMVKPKYVVSGHHMTLECWAGVPKLTHFWVLHNVSTMKARRANKLLKLKLKYLFYKLI